MGKPAGGVPNIWQVTGVLGTCWSSAVHSVQDFHLGREGCQKDLCGQSMLFPQGGTAVSGYPPVTVIQILLRIT